MTKAQETTEIKYRLSKYILQILSDAGTITVDENQKYSLTSDNIPCLSAWIKK